jgi:glycosyltransferase involved in cell wall biosynthesis
MIPSAPLVSCVITFLNARPYLASAIESVLAQDYPHWELILVDDGSNDGSSEIATAIASRDDRVRYLQHQGHRNLGKSTSRNLGFESCRGSLIAMLDADDEWLPGRVTEHVALLAQHPGAGMAFGSVLYWSSWAGSPPKVGGRERPSRIPYAAGAEIPPPILLCDMLVEDGNRRETICPYPSAVTFRRTILEEVGRMEPQFQLLYDDVAFFSKIFLHRAVVVSHTVCAKYRLTPTEQYSTSYEDALRSGEWHPTRRNPAEDRYLSWLERYALATGNLHGRLEQALRVARRPYRHPHIFAMFLGARRFARRVARLFGRPANAR